MLPPLVSRALPLLAAFFTFSLARPTALIAPITKDPATLQYWTLVRLATPLRATKLVVDLGASFLWVDCQKHYNSTTYVPVPCKSQLCTSLASLACGNCYSTPRPGCSNDTCSLYPENPITRKASLDDALQDALAIPTTDGHNVGQLAFLPRFLFSCSRTFLLKGLAKHVSGMAALGRSNFSVPSQISAALSFPRQFALCLSPSPSAPGVVFFGSGPYIFLPSNVDLSLSLVYTPLIVNPVAGTVVTFYGRPSDEYFIGVKSIEVNGREIPLNTSLLAIDENGRGGTKLSTVVPYTTLHTVIYKSLTSALIREAAVMNISRVGSVKPFEVCFSSKNVPSTRVGLAVPTIDLVLQSEGVFWRVFGANSMVEVEEEKDVVCLGFLDGGVDARTSVVIGGYQLEDNLLQFDLGGSRLGFTSSLLFRQTACANFNFTASKP